MTKIINGVNGIENKELEFLASELKNGKIFILPTSTIYGICANAFDEEAVKKVYDIKKRDRSKPLIVLVNNIEMLKRLVLNLEDIHKKIIDRFWPGALTIIFKKNSILSNTVTANKDTVAIRMDSNDIVQKLINFADVPIVAPSANISGNININSIDNLEKDVYNKVDYIIDIGKIDDIKESTLVEIKNESIKVLREGKIKKEVLNNLS